MKDNAVARRRIRNKIARKSRRTNRVVSASKRPWFWTANAPKKRGWYGHMLNPNFYHCHEEEPSAVLVARLGEWQRRNQIALAVGLPPCDLWTNRKLNRNERGEP